VNLLPILGTTVVAAAGVVMMFLEWPVLREALRSSRWPTVQGRVITSEFEEGPLEGRYIRTTTGRAVVSYQYQFSGHELTGNRIFVGDKEFGSAYEAQRRVRHYYPGVTVEVFVDPNNPTRAVLERGLSAKQVGKFVLGAFLLAIGVYALTT